MISIKLEHLNNILQQIVIEVLIQMQQEVERDFLGIHNFLSVTLEFINISSIIHTLHHQRRIKSRNEEIGLTIASPLIISWYNLLTLVVHVVNWGQLLLSVYVLVSTEDRNSAEVHGVDQGVVEFGLEPKLSFSDGLSLVV